MKAKKLSKVIRSILLTASQALGKSRMYLSALISRGSYPRTDTLVQIAQACGYKVELVKDGERIELEAE